MTTNLQAFILPGKTNATKTILWAGLAAGVLDALAGVIVYFIFFGYNPFQVLQYIAAGIFGPSAMTGGLLTVLAGAIFHFFTAFAVAAIFFYAFAKVKILRNNVIATGLLYGAAVWAVMNLLIIPISNIPAAPFNIALAVTGILWHAILVGLPIALITSSYYKAKAL